MMLYYMYNYDIRGFLYAVRVLQHVIYIYIYIYLSIYLYIYIYIYI
jgi:hypothetical protein